MYGPWWRIPKKNWADAETPRKRNMHLAGEDCDKVAQATMASAGLKAVTKKLASVKSKLAASRAKSANSH